MFTRFDNVLAKQKTLAGFAKKCGTIKIFVIDSYTGKDLFIGTADEIASTGKELKKLFPVDWIRTDTSMTVKVVKK